jgi:hypothetical protein
MKHIAIIISIVSILCSMPSLINAQNSKCEPGKCTVNISGKYKVELAGCNNYIDIYVLDETHSPVSNKHITGTVEFFYMDETSLMASFQQFFKTNSLRAKVPVHGFYNCKITLNIGTDIIVTYFDNECDPRS